LDKNTNVPKHVAYLSTSLLQNLSFVYGTSDYALDQGLGTYGSWARCGSFDDSIWLACYFLNTIVTNESFSVLFLRSHQQHHAAPEVAI